MINESQVLDPAPRNTDRKTRIPELKTHNLANHNYTITTNIY